MSNLLKALKQPASLLVKPLKTISNLLKHMFHGEQSLEKQESWNCLVQL